jgi:hypothetical protein
LAQLEPANGGSQIIEVSESGAARIADMARKLNGMRESQLIAELDKINKRDRALSFGVYGVEIQPVVIDKGRKYCHGNLLAAMELLRPDLVGHPGGEAELRNHLLQIMRRLV